MTTDIEAIKPPELPPCLLTWENMERIHSLSFSLRHLSDHERGKRELENGFIGDAVALSKGINGIIAHLMEKRKIPLKEGFPGDLRNPITVELFFELMEFSDQEKQLIIKKFEKSIWKFLDFSILKFDEANCIAETVITEEFLLDRMKTFAKTSCFLLIQDKSFKSSPYDHKRYCYLGKDGRREVTADKIKKFISIRMEDMEVAFLNHSDRCKQLIALNHAAIASVHQQILEAMIQPKNVI